MHLRDEYHKSDVVTAFLLVLTAGAATGIGAGVVFFPNLVRLANRQSLAASLGLASGVMLYVSLVEIFDKAVSGFKDAGHEDGKAFQYATFGFFVGIFIMKALDFVVDLLLNKNRLPSMLDIFHKQSATDPESSDRAEFEQNSENRESDEEVVSENGTEPPSLPENSHEKSSLVRLSVATALAIMMHNLPEGLVTFVGYMDDPAVGTVLGVAIMIHNIPEGLFVAMPLFYATRNRCQAFWWGILSGLSEPLGALIGYFVLGASFSGNAYGVLFSITSGIMTLLAIDELLPSAHRYDPSNSVVTWSVIFGMAVMAVSLLLFSR